MSRLKLYRWFKGGTWYYVEWMDAIRWHKKKRYWTRSCPSPFDYPYEVVLKRESY